jgi:hypothetical protein
MPTPRKYFTEKERKKGRAEAVARYRAKNLEKVREYGRIYDRAHRKEQAEWRRDRIKKLAKEKRRRGCVKCGIRDVRVLDFHHRDPKEKKFNIGAWPHASQKRLDEEVAKCDVMCSNCHRIEEHRRRKRGRIF